MPSVQAALVEIVRHFMEAHRLMGRLSRQFRSGKLSFEQLAELIGDDERSVLYVLKERCHALFRRDSGSDLGPVRRDALFDLAVGALFHEAMKFRENFYQREVYGPRMRALRDQSAEEVNGIFREFEKILGTVEQRLSEGLQETEALLAQTRDQLRILLVEHREEGLVTRFLIERRVQAEEVFGGEIDSLLSEIHGDPAGGYSVAGLSYLESGHYPEARSAFEQALACGGSSRDLERWSAYARGMAAYLEGRYAESVELLERWAGEGARRDASLAALAHAAATRIGQRGRPDKRGSLEIAAVALAERIAAARESTRAAQA